MANLLLYVPKLEATADPRVKSGLLLPYTEPGLTNLGKVTASKGALKLAEHPDPLTLEHADKLPVADFVAFEETDEGLRCAVRYLETPLGTAALAEFDAGTRTGLSVEVDEPVIRAGRLMAGTVSGGSQVEDPAFPSAKLAAAEAPTAPDTGDAPTMPKVVIDGAELADVTDVTVTDAEIDITTKTTDAAPAGPDNQEEPKVTASAVVQNAALVAAKTEPVTKEKLFATLAGAHQQGLSTRRMEAALSDVVPANILGVDQPQYVGQLWDGVPYERRYVPLFAHKDLTSWAVKGWDWTTKPAVALYDGNKGAIPSAEIDTEEKDGVLQRIAGGHDIDRKFKDFSSPDFWAAYFDAMAESYAKVSDQYIRDQVKAIPTVANGGRVHLLTSAAPAGVPTALWQVVEGCAQVLTNLDTLPTFAMVTVDYWKPLLYTRLQDVLAYLDASLNLKDGTLAGGGFKIVPVPVGSLTVSSWVGKTLVGHQNAVTVYELPGAPIRVEAEAIANGGIDEALFGYVGYMVENVQGLVSMDAPAAS